MENSNKIVPPHLNAEVYRTDITGTDSLSYLDYIYCHKDGSILVGCSELTGRYWNGGASIFKTVAESQKFQNEGKKSINLTSGTADGCFVESSDKVLLCEDSGSISIWSNHDDAWQHWTQEMLVSEHDDIIMALDCLDEGKEYVTAGADGNIKVWDINELICIRNYSSAHSMAIYGVAVRTNTTTSFASASLDQYITLWDDNIAKPVLDIVKNDCGIYCLRWMDENRLVYGDEAGFLRVVDVRNPDNVSTLFEFPAAVHKIAVQHESSKIAVCCDNKTVSVLKLDENNKSKTIYVDRRSHNNYIRGVAWDVNDIKVLHTSGWDGKIISHRVE